MDYRTMWLTVNDGRLRFWLSPYGAIGDQYFIDDVILEKV